jgi:PPK2 family polyphosphate:nucleotide phosphotransferase
MDISEALERSRKFSAPFRVTDGEKFRLKDFDPADTMHLGGEDKPAAKEMLQAGVGFLAELQERLYAADRWSLLLVFQAMDAAGKDGTIKHVMSGVNPQGCQVYSFKVPSEEDLDHDYLWRYAQRMPERGRIGIFNRSYYEEVLVVRVHPQLLARQKLPAPVVGDDIWKDRFKDIRRFEKYLTRQGTIVRKFFLHVSKEEQKKRFIDRLDHPQKNWKFSPADVAERGHWDEYQKCYAEAIAATASEEAPWYVVPADNKWFTHLVVVAAVVDALGSLGLEFPVIDPAKKRALAEARAALMAE